jgi:hypothetical protein
MANVYVDSNAAGAGTGADWANAYTTLAAAATAKAAGDVFYVAHNHAETQASAMTITFPGTAASPNVCLCVTSAGTVPPVAADLRTTATVTTTGANAMTIVGFVYCYGITFNAGTGAVTSNITVAATSTSSQYFKNCALKKLGTTGNTAAVQIGVNGTSAGTRVVLDNTPLTFGATSDRIRILGGAEVTWKDTAGAIAGTAPTTLIDSTTTTAGVVSCSNLDISAYSGTLVSAQLYAKRFLFKNCKLHASATIAATPTATTSVIDVVNCDSGDTNYRTERYSYMGTLTTETTIVRTGGASDGTTPIAWKIVTTANSEWVEPFECPPIAIWNETTGSAITVTVQGIWGGGAVPNNDEIWIDVEYLGTSGFPLGVAATSNKASYLATSAATAAGTGTWGGSTTKFALAASFTPQEKGPIYVTVRAATASTTFYIDPKVTVS